MKDRLAHLDLLRGVAALLVCTEHLRAFLLVNYGHIAKPEVWDRVFYFVTGLGHQAVMIFFVLSGYFVGGSVVNAYGEKKWSWVRYATRRLSRLWVVLLPALLLTLIWDETGRHLAQAGYHGGFHKLYCSGPSLERPADMRAVTFFGNCFFLQTIYVPAFGTNGPLWSLANEFWYYILFPLALGAFRQPRFLYRVLSGMLFLGIGVCLPSKILWGGVIWLFGVAVYAAGHHSGLRRLCSLSPWLFLTGGLAMASLVASKTSSLFGSDWAIGGAFALFIAGLAVRNSREGLYTKLAAATGESSYTLYVAHFPFLAFIFFVFFNGEQFQPGLMAFCRYFGILFTVFLYSALVWWCFERNTQLIRRWLESKLHFLGWGGISASRDAVS